MVTQEHFESRSIGLVPLVGDVEDASSDSRHSTDRDTPEIDDYLLPSFQHQKPPRRFQCPDFLSSNPSRKMASLFLSFCRELLPSFVHQPLRQTPVTGQPPANRPNGTIQYLDGLRGIACLIVFNFHYLYPYTTTIKGGYGRPVAPESTRHNMWLHQLPIICLLHRGRAMVVLFFGISGYVLSYRYLSLLRSHSWESSQKTLASMALRRWARLYLPSTASMLIVMVAAYLGAYNNGRRFQDSEWKTGTWEEHPPQHATFGAQIQDFWKMFWEWNSVWNWNLFYSNYDPHTWTIPLEFRSSIFLFMSLVVRTRLRLLWGFLSTLLMTVYCFCWGRWDVGVFLGGSLVADLHLNATLAKSESSTLPLHQTAKKGKIFTICVWVMIVVGIFVMSFPDDAADVTPGFMMLHSITSRRLGPPAMFWQALACTMLIWCMGVQENARGLFETRFAQYFGKISFAFYLTHGPLLHSIGFWLVPSIWRLFGHDTLIQWLAGLFVGYCIMLVLAVVVADLFWRWVDVVSVNFTRRMEKLVSVY